MNQYLQYNILNAPISLLELYETKINSELKSLVYRFEKNKEDKDLIFQPVISALSEILKNIEFIANNRGKIEIPQKISLYLKSLNSLKSGDYKKSQISQVLADSSEFIGFLNKYFENSEISDLQSEIENCITSIENNDEETLTYKEASQLILKKLQYYSLFVGSAGIDLNYFEGLPIEPPYGLDDKQSPRIVLKDLYQSLKYSLLEIKTITTATNSKIKLVKLIYNEYQIQIGSNSFEYINEPKWKGWIFKDNPSKKNFKELIIYELPGIISGLIHDLKQTIYYSDRKDICIQDALKMARKERAATIEINKQAFYNWPVKERSFKTIKTRYKKPFLLLLATILLFMIFLAIYHKNKILAPLQFIDSSITWILFLLMAYLIYLCIYGIIGKIGAYRVNKQDVSMIKEVLLSKELKMNTSVFNVADYHDCQKIEDIDNWLTYCALFIRNLPNKRKKELIEKYSLNHVISIDVNLLNFLVPIIENRQKSKVEIEILREVFPLQMIIIPAVNDIHVVELVNHKITKVNYPNIVFLLALEERDKKTVSIIEEAKKKGKFKGQVFTYFGPVELNNTPGTQAKPKNKPKNVNKTLSHFLAGHYNITENGFDTIPKPDYLMIWDLEDDPGESQVWSMIVSNTIIKTTSTEILDLFQGNHNQNKILSVSDLKKSKPELYQNMKRFGINPNLSQKLAWRYKKSAESIDNSIMNQPDYLELLIKKIDIEADCIVLKNIKRQKEDFNKQANSLDSLIETEKLLNLSESKYERLLDKYRSEENFVKAEFNRRIIPADTQGILVARMYSDSSMSHLEWVMWFELILPGLLRFRYDYTIFTGVFAGILIGALSGGFVMAVFYSIIGAILGMATGIFFTKLGFDTRNKIGLSFSAGTTNNFDYNTLTDVISLYPEYNVAEDWSIALRLSKMNYRSLLINGYNTPTYEDSLAPLGPRMWSQHSRWIGGHFQSFPQVFVSIKKIFSEFGLANWIHSVANIVLLSIAPVLTAYIIFKSLIAFIAQSFYLFLPKYYDNTFLEILIGIKHFLWKLAWWMPHDPYTGIILLLSGPILLIILGSIPILFHRSDDKIMVAKSVEDLKRQRAELINNKNSDIQKLKLELNKLTEISKRISESGNFEKVAAFLDDDLKHAEMCYKLKLVKGFWEDKGNQHLLNRIVKTNGNNSDEILKNIAEKLQIKLQFEVGKKIGFLSQKINRCEKGIVNLGVLKFEVGQYTYAFLLKLLMNIGMIYYYLHATMAVFMYFGQINKNMDSMWRQTGHRLYGTGFSGKLKKEFKKIAMKYIKA